MVHQWCLKGWSQQRRCCNTATPEVVGAAAVADVWQARSARWLFYYEVTGDVDLRAAASALSRLAAALTRVTCAGGAALLARRCRETCASWDGSHAVVQSSANPAA